MQRNTASTAKILRAKNRPKIFDAISRFGSRNDMFPLHPERAVMLQ